MIFSTYHQNLVSSQAHTEAGRGYEANTYKDDKLTILSCIKNLI